jgi:signal transduction histidine kinase
MKDNIRLIKRLSIGFVVISIISIIAAISYRTFDLDKLELEKNLLTQSNQIEILTNKLFDQHKENINNKDLSLEVFLDDLELISNAEKIKLLRDRVRREGDIVGSVFGILLFAGSSLFIVIIIVIKRRNRDRKEWLDTTAHQLRKSVSPMCVSLNNLLTLDLSKSEYDKTLKMVANDARKLEDLTEKMLDLYKLGQEKTIKKHDINIGLIINQAEYIFKILNKKNLEFSIIDDGDIKQKTISVHPDYVEQVIKNLIDNAIGFSHLNGKILVNIFNKDGFTVFNIIDQGIGIKDKNKIFADGAVYPSVRVDEHSTGHGLGLKLVRRIMKLHNGKFDINNNEDSEGVTATVKFPL